MGSIYSSITAVLFSRMDQSYSVQTHPRLQSANDTTSKYVLRHKYNMFIQLYNLDFRLRQIMDQLDSGNSLSLTDMRQELGRAVAMLDKVNSTSPVKDFRWVV